jgi:CubicO group peptidase (beta-lactamase class C family)
MHHRGPISQAYREALGGDIDSHVAPDDWIARLAQMPLIGQPGAMMSYGRATDLLGLLIARIEGEPLGAVLKRRIFDPSGMKDTGFLVPPAKRDRRAAAYGFNDEGRLIKRTTWSGVVVPERPEDMTHESGGSGLWSTVDDYLRFSQVFLGNGSVDGVRLLRPETLSRMMTNQLTEAQRVHSGWLGRKPFAAGRGFGLGVSVVLETNRSDLMRRGGVGTVSWPEHTEDGGKPIPVTDRSSFSWLTIWLIWRRWRRVSGLVSGPRLMRFRHRQRAHIPDDFRQKLRRYVERPLTL